LRRSPAATLADVYLVLDDLKTGRVLRLLDEELATETTITDWIAEWSV